MPFTSLDKKSYSPYRPYICLIVALLQNMTLGGVIFGWPSLSGRFIAELGISEGFSQAIFSVSTFCSFLSPFMGIILDKYGPRINSVMCIVMVGVGCLLVSTSSSFTPKWVYLVSMCMIAFGGRGNHISLIHLTNMFPLSKESITSVIFGCFQSSFLVLFFFDIILRSNKSWSLRTLFGIYIFVCLINLAGSYFLWPDKPVRIQDALDFENNPDRRTSYRYLREADLSVGALRMPSVFIKRNIRTSPRCSGSSLQPHSTERQPYQLASSFPSAQNQNEASSASSKYTMVFQPALLAYAPIHSSTSSSRKSSTRPRGVGNATVSSKVVSNESAREDTKSEELPWYRDKLFRDKLKSAAFFRVVLFVSTTTFWQYLYIGTFHQQLRNSYHCDEKEVVYFSHVLTITMAAMALVIPCVSLCIKRIGYTRTAFVTILFSILWSFLTCIHIKAFLYPAILFFGLARIFVHTYMFAYLADSLGDDYFGILSGIMCVSAGTLYLFHIPIGMWLRSDCGTMNPVLLTRNSPHHHVNENINLEHCLIHRWLILNRIQAVSLLLLFGFCVWDAIDRYRFRRKKLDSYEFSGIPFINDLSLPTSIYRRVHSQGNLAGPAAEGTWRNLSTPSSDKESPSSLLYESLSPQVKFSDNDPLTEPANYLLRNITVKWEKWNAHVQKDNQNAPIVYGSIHDVGITNRISIRQMPKK